MSINIGRLLGKGENSFFSALPLSPNDIKYIWCNQFTEILDEAASQFGLGKIDKNSISPLSGGYSHKNYFIKSHNGAFAPRRKYVLKEKEVTKNWGDRIWLWDEDEMIWHEYEVITHILNNKKLIISAPKIYLTHKGSPYIKKNGRYFILYEFKIGKIPGWGGIVGGRVKESASTLAHVHSLLSYFRYKNEPLWGLTFYEKFKSAHSLFKYLQKRLKDKKLNELNKIEKYALKNCDFILSQYEDISRDFPHAEYYNLPKQYIHGDFSPVNLLFEGDQLTAILDWEKVAFDTRLRDFFKGIFLAYDEATLSNMYEFVKEYQYHASRFDLPLNKEEIDALPFFLRMSYLDLLSGLASPSSNKDLEIKTLGNRDCPHCYWPYKDDIDPIEFYEMQIKPLKKLKNYD